MHQLRSNILISTVIISLLSMLSCKKESHPLIDGYNIIDVDENILNHYHLTIPAASSSLLQRSDPVVFTADSIVTKMRIVGFTSGSGQVDVLDANNSLIFTAAISRDTTITDTIRSVQPKRVIIVFNRFSGGFDFRMD